jgi:hypothetical protein
VQGGKIKERKKENGVGMKEGRSDLAGIFLGHGLGMQSDREEENARDALNILFRMRVASRVSITHGCLATSFCHGFLLIWAWQHEEMVSCWLKAFLLSPSCVYRRYTEPKNSLTRHISDVINLGPVRRRFVTADINLYSGELGSRHQQTQ